MKFLLPFILFIVSVFNITSQEIDENNLQKLHKLNLNTQNLDLTNLETQKNLHLILNLEKKRKTNKILGIVLVSAATVSAVTGSILLGKENTTSDVFGGVFLAGSAIYAGVSMPFWNASKKRKKERDKLIELFK